MKKVENYKLLKSNKMFYFIIFCFTLVLSIIFTNLVIQIAKKLQIVDKPTKDRKIHRKTIPLLGGFAIFASYLAFSFLKKPHWTITFITKKTIT